LGVSRQEAEAGHPQLIQAVVSLRSIKTAEEIAEIVTATNRSRRAHLIAMRAAQPGLIESDVVRAMRSDAARLGYVEAYGPVFTIRGEVLHNPFHENVMTDGALALHDGAIMSDLGYASDITRTFPVNGTFTSAQRTVCQTVLEAQTRVIEVCKPGVMYNDMHTLAMGTVFDGLRDLGITKGDTTDALEAGAPALFMPHGIGHMLGLDVHDMEEIGEDYVGYDSTISRSPQFGRSNLRLARELQDGFVMTVEPGCYFIPALIDQWDAEGTWTEWINFDRLRDFRDFGGVRIEDIVHVTPEGAEVLGNHIPKTIEEVEAACA
jgi:Xaa-Pro aminopeptidase